MKRIGRLAILTFAEYESLMCRTEDAEAHAGDFAEELSRMGETRRGELKKAYFAGKWHSAGGYAHALKETRGNLKQAQDLLAQWRPFVEVLETFSGQLTEPCND